MRIVHAGPIDIAEMLDDRAHCIGSRRTLKTELLLRPDYRLCSLNVIICTWKAAGELGDFLHTVGHGLVQALALIFCSLFSQTVLLLLRLCTESLQSFAFLDPICFYF